MVSNCFFFQIVINVTQLEWRSATWRGAGKKIIFGPGKSFSQIGAWRLLPGKESGGCWDFCWELVLCGIHCCLADCRGKNDFWPGKIIEIGDWQVLTRKDRTHKHTDRTRRETHAERPAEKAGCPETCWGLSPGPSVYKTDALPLS